MAKLWAKGYDLNEVIERFTVGEDYILDRRLVVADCIGSAAHARMLAATGLLTETEARKIGLGLAKIARESAAGTFEVRREHEDGHTAIENTLIGDLGEAGKKLHTGRSRNDQILLTLRIFEREFILAAMEDLLDLIAELLTFAEEHRRVPMVGRTHMQPAMPSSVGLWAAAWAEELLLDAGLLEHAFVWVNRSPLGSAASYGTSLPLDREMVADLLAFDGLLTNVLWANNSRGKIESVLLDALEQIGLTLSKMAQDLIFFSLPEFGYFTIPEELCTGSSIMPQKRNPDGLELLRAKSATVSAHAGHVRDLIRSLPSGYNRDFQETKAPLLRGMDTTVASLRVMTLTIRKVGVNRERLRAAFSPEVFATDAAYELVRSGVPFRDAYRRVAKELDKLELPDAETAIDARTATGTPGNLRLDLPSSEVEDMRRRINARWEKISAVSERLLGGRIAAYR